MYWKPLIACAGLLVCVGAASASRPPAVRVDIDTTDAPDAAQWATGAKALVEKWYPRVARALATKDYRPPDELTLAFSSHYRGVAATAGRRITISDAWIRRHPDDTGMVIHEMTHVIQGYPRYDAPWLVEGIADYVRFYLYEPKARLAPVNAERATYHDGYRTTAQFLAFIVQHRDRHAIAQLNAALRAGTYTDGLFQQLTHETPDQLWTDFLHSDAGRNGRAAAG